MADPLFCRNLSLPPPFLLSILQFFQILGNFFKSKAKSKILQRSSICFEILGFLLVIDAGEGISLEKYS